MLSFYKGDSFIKKKYIELFAQAKVYNSLIISILGAIISKNFISIYGSKKKHIRTIKKTFGASI